MKIFVAIVLVDVMTSCLFADPLHVQSDGTFITLICEKRSKLCLRKKQKTIL